LTPCAIVAPFVVGLYGCALLPALFPFLCSVSSVFGTLSSGFAVFLRLVCVVLFVAFV
jgi:hypothetical protein